MNCYFKNCRDPKVRSGSHDSATFVFSIVMIFVFPVFLVTSSLQHIVMSDWLYSYNWWRNEIPSKTNLENLELDNGSDQIKEYFKNDDKFLDVRIIRFGEEFSLFREREILHMYDVKVLIRAVFSVATFTGFILLSFFVFGWVYFRSSVWELLMKSLKVSSILSGLSAGLLTVIMFVDFSAVFRYFHILSFTNDLWLLDPKNDYLLIMFPERFFFETTMLIAVVSVIQFIFFYFAVSVLRNKKFDTKI